MWSDPVEVFQANSYIIIKLLPRTISPLLPIIYDSFIFWSTFIIEPDNDNPISPNLSVKLHSSIMRARSYTPLSRRAG